MYFWMINYLDFFNFSSGFRVDTGYEFVVLIISISSGRVLKILIPLPLFSSLGLKIHR